MKIGFHVSITGSLSNSIKNAEEIGCTAFQIFTRNPRGWIPKHLERKDVDEFKSKLENSYIDKKNVVVHMPYLPNFAAPESESYYKSKKVLSEEIIRCYLLDISYLILHLGSHLGFGEKNGIKQIVNACNFALDNFNSLYRRHLNLNILIENSAGQKNSIGSKFDEIKDILDELNNKKFGVCFDSCHAFASGYDLRTSNKVIETIDNFNDIINIKNLKVLHLNDSKGKINENIDRHEHIGLGSIGKEGLIEFLKHKYFQNIPIIMETPNDKTRGDKENMKVILDYIEDEKIELNIPRKI
ncbi:MAG TPA: deoxyribonuclease IV [Nitrososphaeraceae archaeon]|nr:deoxyribonuclease IV [Nitrososphaeraceae archaeon]